MEVHGISVDGFAGLSEIPSLVLFLLIFLGRKREVPKGSDPRVVDKSTRHTASPPNIGPIGWSVKFVSTVSLFLSPRI